MYNMRLQNKYFNLIKSGSKTIELRLFDNKRKNIKIGYIIEFSNSSDADDKFSVQVVNLHRADNFFILCKNIDCQKAGFSSSDELIRVLEEFYPFEQQQTFGVVGIEIALI